MTPPAPLSDPASHPSPYVSSVLTLYVDLPDTPLRANAQDQRQARHWFDRRISLSTVETALLLASLRRRIRPSDLPPLPRIHSLAYFQPVIEELLESPVPDGYLEYLRLKLRSIVDKTVSTDVQKNTFSEDR
jgi:hypothetical protein